MRTIKLIIEYDGSEYSGWQIQPNGLSIQEVLEEAFSRLLKEKVRIFSSGRTDAGVHARGMVAALRTEKNIPIRAFSDGINCLLPPDIAVWHAEEVSPDFNPRRDASGKHYRYTILNSAHRSPLSRLFSWRVPGGLDVPAMVAGGRYFLGEKDFAAFRAANCAAKTTVRRIDALDISRSGDLIHIDVRGSGFLKYMVRIMVGTLVGIGLGKVRPEEVAEMLKSADRRQAGSTAPPQGLCLMEVFF